MIGFIQGFAVFVSLFVAIGIGQCSELSPRDYIKVAIIVYITGCHPYNLARITAGKEEPLTSSRESLPISIEVARVEIDRIGTRIGNYGAILNIDIGFIVISAASGNDIEVSITIYISNNNARRWHAVFNVQAIFSQKSPALVIQVDRAILPTGNEVKVAIPIDVCHNGRLYTIIFTAKGAR